MTTSALVIETVLTGVAETIASGKTVSITEEKFHLQTREAFEAARSSKINRLIIALDQQLLTEAAHRLHLPDFHSLPIYPRVYRFDDELGAFLSVIRASLLRKQAIFGLHSQFFSLLAEKVLADQQSVHTALTSLPFKKSITRHHLLHCVEQGREMIYEQFDHPLDLQTIARFSGLSLFHFQRTFTLVYGMSPHQLLQRIRLNRAQLLLRETTLPVAEIAMQVGFTEPRTFSRSYKRTFGSLPTSERTTLK